MAYDVTKLKSAVDTIFNYLTHSLIARWFPRLQAVLATWRAAVDKDIDTIAANLPPAPTWLQVIDAIITFLIAAFPAEATLLQEVKTLLDWIFGPAPAMP